MELKRCPKCGKSLPATTEYFHADKHKKNGLRSTCKSCVSKHNHKAPPAICAYCKNEFRPYVGSIGKYCSRQCSSLGVARERFGDPPERKVCPRCKTEYPATTEYFHRHKSTRTGLRSVCKTCERLVSLKYRNEHLETSTVNSRKWKAANPDKVSIHNRVMNAKRRRAPGKFTKADIQRIYQAQRGKCYYCGVSVGDDYHVDHVISLSRGGTNWPDNLVIACPTCNIHKQNKLPHEWSEGGKLL